ncbi:UNVERIFIED_CONTAM: hypothetical protein Scaly_2845600 [Sesamum calycinum]|uniref:Methyltransferase type 11 domain-containing protein n=1 Tax=Sesamum calycinum TaxID=2727403 RepID=A0AAW2IRW1_9LAMI
MHWRSGRPRSSCPETGRSSRLRRNRSSALSSTCLEGRCQPFDDETFDFEFSNVFDHALYPWKFVGEIERTLKRGGVCVLHVLLSRRADKYSANDLYSVKPLEQLFKNSELVEVRSIDGFGLDTEVVFRKKI